MNFFQGSPLSMLYVKLEIPRNFVKINTWYKSSQTIDLLTKYNKLFCKRHPIPIIYVSISIQKYYYYLINQ